MFQNESVIIETHVFWGQGHESQKHCRHESLDFCECWLLVE